MRRHRDQTGTDCYLNQVEAAQYIGFSLRWLQQRLKESGNPPPGFKFGKAWRFRKSELDSWLEHYRVRPDLAALVDDIRGEARASNLRECVTYETQRAGEAMPD
jgi:predicted DNA-binding transcriptional regulator AlpA